MSKRSMHVGRVRVGRLLRSAALAKIGGGSVVGLVAVATAITPLFATSPAFANGSSSGGCTPPHAGTFPSPPPGSSPLTMTPVERQEYGFPAAPPAGSPTYGAWVQAMEKETRAVVPEFSCSITSAGPAQPATDPGSGSGSPSASNSYNWSGYQANGTFSGIQGTFNVPYVKAIDPSIDRYESSWVGDGRDAPATPAQMSWCRQA
jgi:hypothetical protein